MSLSSEEESFLKELARRAKAQNVGIAVSIATRVGRVTVSPEENRHLDTVCARESKTGTELIDPYL
jgi:hypothetical protein